MKFNIIILTLLISLISCSKKEVKDKNNLSNTSMFELGEINVTNVRVYASDEKWPDIKDKMVFSLSTCLLDTYYSEKVSGADFRIQSPYTDIMSSTKMAGCLYWNEVVDFNYMAQEDDLLLSGTIEGKSFFKGTQKYHLIINPWSGEVKPLQSISYYKFYDLQKRLQAANSFHTSLYIDSVNYSIEQKYFNNKESFLKLAVKFSPEFKRFGKDGTLKRSIFSGGVFKLKYYLIEKDHYNGDRKILATHTKEASYLKDGQVQNEVKFKINNYIEDGKKVELALELTAVDPPSSLGRLEGTVEVGTIAGSKNSKFIENKATQLSYLSFKKNDNKKLSLLKKGVIIDKVLIRRARTVHNNGNNKVSAEVKVCLVDPLLKKAIPNHDFRVKINEVIDGVVAKSIFDGNDRTNHKDGCLMVRPQISYSDLNTRYWKKYVVEVSSSSSPFIDVSQTRKIFINPWIENIDFGIDSEDEDDLPVEYDKNKPFFYIKDITYEKTNPIEKSFVLKQDLTFNFDLLYSFTITPKIKMEENYEKNKAFMDVPNGKYRLRGAVYVPGREMDYAVEKITLDDYTVLTGFDKIVKVEDGVINAQINLPFNIQNLHYITTRNAILLELSAIEKNVDIQPGFSFSLFRGSIEKYKSQKLEGFDIKKTQEKTNLQTYLTKSIAEHREFLNVKRGIKGYNSNTFVDHLNSIDEQVYTGNYNSDVKNWDFQYKEIETTKINNIEKYFKKNDIKLTRKELDRIIRKPESDKEEDVIKLAVSNEKLKEICKLFFNRPDIVIKNTRMNFKAQKHKGLSPIRENCLENPRRFLEFKKFHHTVKVNPKPLSVVTSTDQVFFSNAKFTSRGQQHNQISGQRISNYSQAQSELFGSPALLASTPDATNKKSRLGKLFNKIPFLSGLKVEVMGGLRISDGGGTRDDHYSLDSNSDVFSYLDRQIIESGVKYKVDTFNITFKAVVNSCLLISTKLFKVDYIKETTKLNPTRDDLIDQIPVKSHQRYYVCTEGEKEITISEDWYAMAIATGGNINSIEKQVGQFVAIIRGKENYEVLKDTEFMKNVELLLFGEDEDSTNKFYQNYSKSVRGAFAEDYQYQHGAKYPGILN